MDNNSFFNAVYVRKDQGYNKALRDFFNGLEAICAFPGRTWVHYTPDKQPQFKDGKRVSMAHTIAKLLTIGVFAYLRNVRYSLVAGAALLSAFTLRTILRARVSTLFPASSNGRDNLAPQPQPQPQIGAGAGEGDGNSKTPSLSTSAPTSASTSASRPQQGAGSDGSKRKMGGGAPADGKGGGVVLVGGGVEEKIKRLPFLNMNGDMLTIDLTLVNKLDDDKLYEYKEVLMDAHKNRLKIEVKFPEDPKALTLAQRANATQLSFIHEVIALKDVRSKGFTHDDDYCTRATNHSVGRLSSELLSFPEGFGGLFVGGWYDTGTLRAFCPSKEEDVNAVNRDFDHEIDNSNRNDLPQSIAKHLRNKAFDSAWNCGGMNSDELFVTEANGFVSEGKVSPISEYVDLTRFDCTKVSSQHKEQIQSILAEFKINITVEAAYTDRDFKLRIPYTAAKKLFALQRSNSVENFHFWVNVPKEVLSSENFERAILGVVGDIIRGKNVLAFCHQGKDRSVALSLAALALIYGIKYEPQAGEWNITLSKDRIEKVYGEHNDLMHYMLFQRPLGNQTYLLEGDKPLAADEGDLYKNVFLKNMIQAVRNIRARYPSLAALVEATGDE